MKKVVVGVGNLSMSNEFDVFGIPVKYNIDPVDLGEKFRRAQVTIHPDRFVGRPELEKTLAAKHSLQINEAYQTLKDPVKRAAAYLKALGLDVPGENGQTVSHPTLLLQVMQWQEDLEACQQERDLDLLASALSKRLDFVKHAFDTTDRESLTYLYLEFVYISKILDEIKHHPLRRDHADTTR